MRIVFMGTPAFAVPSLEALLAHHEVTAVYTQPDRPAGRGRRPRPSAVKRAADTASVPIRQPAVLDEAEVDALQTLAPDVVCVAAYGLILPPAFLEVPRHGCVNVHASLLPRHRGAAPVHRALLDGDEYTGVSIMRMEAGLDTGPVALARKVRVDDYGVEELTTLLARAGAEALLEVLDHIRRGTVTWTPQNTSKATYARKVDREDVALDPSLSVEQAVRRVLASSRRTPSRVLLCGNEVALLEVERSDRDVAPGRMRLDREGPVIGLADGALRITRMRPAGRGEMSGEGFVCGNREDSDTWGPVR